MGNIDFLNFRRAPSDEDLAESVHEILNALMPDLEYTITTPCLCIEFGLIGDDGQIAYSDRFDSIQYWRYSTRRIGCKSPRREWTRWLWYHIKARLLEKYGGTNRNEFDMSETFEYELDKYPTFRDWLEAMHPNHALLTKSKNPIKIAAIEAGRRIIINSTLERTGDRILEINLEDI